MPKVIELTVEIDLHKVSCPGVWLCQDGRVSLSVFALGTNYQTCLLPPVFPLMFKDVFYFRKRYQESCALSNISCLLRDETIYCELVQRPDNCLNGPCIILAQYLGGLNEVLFPPNLCSNDGVDLLMRRSKDFPGILSPKIEITTKVRIDELWNKAGFDSIPSTKGPSCQCANLENELRQRPVCHSAQYHRKKCQERSQTSMNKPRCRSRSRSTGGSQSCCSLKPMSNDFDVDPKLNTWRCPAKPVCPHGVCKPPPCCRSPRAYAVYNVEADTDTGWRNALGHDDSSLGDDVPRIPELHSLSAAGSPESFVNEASRNKIQLESRYIELTDPRRDKYSISSVTRKHSISPCVCEICTRYHELFHAGQTDS